MEPVDEWTVPELKAELKELGISNSGNKQELYERLLEFEEEEDDEDGFDASELGRSIIGAVVSNRLALGAVFAVAILVASGLSSNPMTHPLQAHFRC